MSVNAISSVSLYEYYYSINQKSKKKKTSPIAQEMKQYGLTPTDDEQLNIAMLEKAKRTHKTDNSKENDTSPEQRPWADLMYQLDLKFNANPKDDIQDIKDELAKLTKGISDDELDSEIKDLENYVEKLYVQFEQNAQGSINLSDSLGKQLNNNLSIINKVNLL